MGKRRSSKRWVGGVVVLVLILLVAALVVLRLRAVWIDRDLAAAYRVIAENASKDALIVVPESEAAAARYYGKRGTIPPRQVQDRLRQGAVSIQDFLNRPMESRGPPLYVVVTMRDLDRLADWGFEGGPALYFTKPTLAITPMGFDVWFTGDNATLYQIRNATDTVGYLLDRTGANQTVGAYLQDTGLVRKEGAGCLLLSEVVAYVDDDGCSLPLLRMLAGHPYGGAAIVHEAPHIKVYKIG